MPENKFSPKPQWSVRSIAICALLTALSVILASADPHAQRDYPLFH